MPQGFLAVLSQPSSSLTIEDFHAWYEEEHIPLRLNHLPSFLSGARYQAIDPAEAGPGWLAMYEIDDVRTFREPSYADLRKKRSARESDVMSRLDVLLRYAGEDLGVWGDDDARESTTTGLKVGKPSVGVVTHILDVQYEGIADKVLKSWANQVASAGATVEGWVRVRVVKVLEGGTAKMGVTVQHAEVKYLVVHEFIAAETASMTALQKQISSTKVEGLNVNQWRTWKLRKAYPCVAQGNLPSNAA